MSEGSRYLEFDILEEGWNEYRLRDEVRIRARTMVRWITVSREGENSFQLSTQIPFFVILTPPHLMGNPERLSTQAIREARKEPVQIVEEHEVWNRYRVRNTDNIIRVRLAVSEILRVVGHFDAEGNPLFSVSSGVIIAPESRTGNNLTP